MGMEDWAGRLEGLGAYWGGNGPQWEIAQNQKRKTLAELDEKRRKELAEDFRYTLLDLKNGDVGGASERLQSRLNGLVKEGRDPSHTAAINRMIQEGRVDEAVQGLQYIDDRAVQAGALPSMADKKLGIAGGQVFYQGAEGPYAKTIEGYDKALGAGAEGGDPAAVREYKFYSTLAPEQQAQYREMKRAQQIVDMGGGLRGVVSGQSAVPLTQNGMTGNDVREDYSTAEADLAGVKAQATELGKGAGEESGGAYKQYTAIKQRLKNYDRAIEAIDKGANSGKIASMFPSIMSSTIELENVRNELALDVVAAVTFGSLSAGELDIARQKAMPELPPKELKSWLIKRKNAQSKLADYYKDVAIYLGKKGNTMASYLEEQEGAQQSAGPSQSDLEFTAQKHGISVEEVRQRLGL